MSTIKTLSYAPDAWKALNGIFCIYKPSGLTQRKFRHTLRFNLCRDLNGLEQRKLRELVSLKGSVCSNKPYEVEMIPNYAEHHLVSGPHYQTQDVRLATISGIGKYTSGVLLMTVNDGCKAIQNPLLHNLVRKYEVKGKFGIATKNFMSDGIVFERSTYSHVKKGLLERLLSNIQASHQCLAYQYAGVSLQSQAAYDLASSGIVKPSVKSDPLIYSIKCTEFKLPYFSLEVHCIHETEEFLAEIIHDLGVDLKSTAVCTQIHRVQYGHFVLSHALLRKHWTLEHILNNISLCRDVLNQDFSSVDFRRIKASVINNHVENMQNKAREESLLY